MQLVPNDSHKDDISEREPILCQPESSQKPVESSASSSLCEITAVGEDDHAITCGLGLQDLEEDDECSLLVNADQPQCRICLDSGGLIVPMFLVS